MCRSVWAKVRGRTCRWRATCREQREYENLPQPRGAGLLHADENPASSISLRPFLIKPARTFGDRSVRGSCACAATRRLRVFPVCLTRSSGVGFNTMGGSTARHSILSGSTSIACSLGGRRGNTRSCTTIFGELSSGSCAYLSAIRDSSLTGNWVAAWLCNGRRMS